MRMASYTQDGQVQFDGSVPTAVFLLENKLMDFNENAKLIVDEEVTKLNLFCLPQNLCNTRIRTHRNISFLRFQFVSLFERKPRVQGTD
jgi:hypothetical protein